MIALLGPPLSSGTTCSLDSIDYADSGLREPGGTHTSVGDNFEGHHQRFLLLEHDRVVRVVRRYLTLEHSPFYGICSTEQHLRQPGPGT